MCKKLQKNTNKSQKDVPYYWMDVYYSTISAFAKVGGLDGAFINVDPSSYWGILSLFEDERTCNKYDDFTIPFYEHTFSVVGVCLSFHAFDIENLKHLATTLSQLHPTIWAYMKFYQYCCEYLNGKPYVTIFSISLNVLMAL